MAGSGYKVFTAGDVLTAADVQGHLQDQAVMRFADSTARATSIGTANFTEGMVSYLDDTDQVEYYDGSTWAGIAPVSNSGLTLLNTTSFSGVSSQSINDVFSATYDNYRILINVTSVTVGATDLRMRMRVSGSDNSSSNYFAAGVVNYTSGAAQALLSANPGDNWDIGRLATSGGSSFMDLVSPYLTDSTKFHARATNRKPSPPEVQHTAGEMSVTTSYTGFTIYPAANAMTGTVRVYGYAN